MKTFIEENKEVIKLLVDRIKKEPKLTLQEAKFEYDQMCSLTVNGNNWLIFVCKRNNQPSYHFNSDPNNRYGLGDFIKEIIKELLDIKYNKTAINLGAKTYEEELAINYFFKNKNVRKLNHILRTYQKSNDEMSDKNHWKTHAKIKIMEWKETIQKTKKYQMDDSY